MRRKQGGERKKKKLSVWFRTVRAIHGRDTECAEVELKANMDYMRPYLKKLKNEIK